MQAVIIAAGESTRFWPLSEGIHKSQVFLLGKPLIYWTIKGLHEAGIEEIMVVHGKDSSLPAMLDQENDLGIKISYAMQEKPLGTGSTLWQAREFITKPFFVVWPSKVNAAEIAKKILLQRKAAKTKAVLVGARTPTPWDYGVARMEGEVVAQIVENPEKGNEPSDIKVIGFYFFEPDFFSYYEKLSKHHEADFIDAVNLYIKDNAAFLVPLEQEVPALKYPWELLGIMDILLGSKKEQQIIHPTAKISKGTLIEGPVYIGENCEIGPHNVLRGPLNLEKGTKTGAFFEIKHSVVQENTHFHSGYVGDSVIGKNCRFAAGFIAANRRFDRTSIVCTVKGKKVDTTLTSFGTVVGNSVHVGIHAGTMPGVFVGAGSIIGPGTMVFEHVQDGTKKRFS
jgi:UDP-N-acetylglucosamine diphosphorylase / glucose-1-phosphate thymidylyltransferase / UDP-N-acetylgalactosamine diphosphorylase / glucosamine-1-phosphate N-acetyltransferase / galactosamine-1-phosphate N-acetyltransferase